jgi:heme O synthase-like polyprenyltransferase
MKVRIDQLVQDKTIEDRYTLSIVTAAKEKLKDYLQLIKVSLSIMVVFSSVVSYEMAPNIINLNWKMVFWLALGGILVTGSARLQGQWLQDE